jgi:2-keto-myo-inositol isomerase
VQELCHFLCYAGQFVGCPDLEVIAAFGAPTDDREEVTAETADVLAELSKIAADYHMRLALEYMGVPKNSVRTYAHAMEIVERTGADNVGLLVDTWHHFAGGSKPEELLGPGSDKIFTVHIGDAPDKAPLTLRRNECIWPGDGAAPIPEMLRNLKKVGYEGIVSVEIFDPGVQAMDPGLCIPLAYERTAQAMKEAGVL